MNQSLLQNLYCERRLSAAEISNNLNISQGKINYWLKKYKIPKRSISDAIYLKKNPHGDPFLVSYPQNLKEGILYGLGIGLYLGEGNRKNKYSIRLGNVDPKIILIFISFLEKFYSIKREKLRFGIQIFSDCSPKKSLKFWQQNLGISKNQFQKVVVTTSRRLGTYGEKNFFGVLTLYFNNRKLREILGRNVDKIYPL